MTSAYLRQRQALGRKAGFCARLFLPLVVALLGVSCGDVYRPVALPVAGQPPTPAPVGHVNVVSTNGIAPANPFLAPGSASRIDVSGDSVVSSIGVGIAPGRPALMPNSTVLFIPNSDEDTVFASPTTAAPQGATINLLPVCNGSFCPPIVPVFAESTEATRMYVAGAGNGTVSVIDTISNAVVHTFPVDPSQSQPDTTSQPVALAELPNGTKIYSVNQGTDSVSSINTLDGHINNVIGVGPAPLWAVANADSLHVYVLDSASKVWVIDAATDTVASQVSAGSPGPHQNYLLYDKVFNRVYVTDANSPQPVLHIYDVTGTSGNPNSTLTPHGASGIAPILAAPGSACTGNAIPTSVAVLGDGTRAYVASYQTGNNLICTQATVIDTASATVTKIIPLSVAPDNAAQTNCDVARFRVSAASSLGGTNSLFKVYVSQCDTGTVAIIDTAAVTAQPSPHPADSLVGWLASPISTFTPSQIAITNATQTAATSTTPATTTFTYASLSGPPIQVGATVYVSGMSDPGNDGGFLVMAADSQNLTFTVSNATGVTASSQSGTGSVLPPQNPVFLLPAP